MPPTKRKTVSAAESARRKKQAQAATPPEPPKQLGRGGGWRKGSELGPQELHLPSGSTCLALQPGLDSLIASGIIDNMDILTAVVDRKLVKPVAKKAPKTTQAQKDQLLGIMELADRVTVACVIEPPVQLAPMPKCKVCKWEGLNMAAHKPEDKHTIELVPRDPDVFYTDGVSVDDKMAIVAFATGGFDSLAQFPGKPDEGVETMESVENLEVPAE